MKLATVIPLARGLPHETLTYYTLSEVAPGALVNVPVGRRQISALVTEIKPLTESRQAVRTADFPFKKMGAVKNRNFLPPAMMTAALQTARFFVLPLGQVLKNFIPQTILSQTEPLKIEGQKTTAVEKVTKSERLVIQDTDEARIAFYKSLIREEFAKNASVFLCLPNLIEIEPATRALGKGIEPYVIVLHPKLSAKILLARWREARNQIHPVVIAATPTFLSLWRPDLKTIIIEKENSDSYKNSWRPLVDARKFAEFLAAATGAKLIFGDIFLRCETLRRAEKGELISLGIKQRLTAPENRTQKIVLAGKQAIISEEIIAKLTASAERAEQSFIIAGRRGLAPLVICRDCGQVVACDECQAPVVLHGATADLEAKPPKGGLASKSLNRLVCHHCGAARSAAEKCRQCQSWKLGQLGIGVEAIAAELKARLPEVKVFHLDRDKVKSNKAADALVSKFSATPGGILLGTEMILYYLKTPVENGLMIGLDSLLALPDFRIREKLFTLLIRAGNQTTAHFMIQTRHEHEPLFMQAIKGNLLEFYRGEIADRQKFNYPPFQRLIKISPATKLLAEKLKEYEPALYPALQKGKKGELILNLLLKINPRHWPNEVLFNQLRALPPSFTVEVDPDQLL